MLLFQVLLGVATCALTHFLASRMLPAGPGADVAALLVAIDGPSATHSVLVLTETLFALAVTAALVALWVARENGSLRWAGVGGLLAGLATLVRPIALYLAGLAALWALLGLRGSSWKRRLVAAGLTGALALLPPLGWMARNAALGQGFALSGIEGANLLLYRAAPVLARVRGITWPAAADELLARFGYRPGQRFQWDARTSREAGRVALEILCTHPLEALAVFADGSLRVWAGPGNTDLMVLLGASPPDPPAATPVTGSRATRLAGWAGSILCWAYRIVASLLMLAGVVVLAHERRAPELAFLGGTIVYFTILSASPGAYARLRVPVTPAACVLAAAGVAAAAAAHRKDKRWFRRPQPGSAPS